MSTYMNRATPQQAYYQRPGVYTAPVPQRVVANVKDDYERWYTETTPNNRMALSVRSGIHSEIAWALDRLCRLGINEQFSYKAYPGLIDGLFEWPEWYVNEGYKSLSDDQDLFGPSKEWASQHRFALESLLILRNISLQDPTELQSHSHTLPLILNGLANLDFTSDRNQEALLLILDIFHGLAPNLFINETVPDASNPLFPLQNIVSKSTNRSLIIAALGAMNGILSHPKNYRQFTKTKESLRAAIRYLPLFVDKTLLEPCLEHIYVHIAHPATARVFLLNPELPSVLKVLCSLVLAEQRPTEEKVTLDITPQYRTTALSSSMTARNYELTNEDLENLLKSSEPHRCYEWMRLVLSPRADAEMTQVDVWTLYKETFGPYSETTPLLGASDVIKYVTHVYPSAQAMVLPAPTQRFIVRGIERRQEMIVNERFKCLWDRSSCPEPAFTSPADLFDHLLQHLGNQQAQPHPCSWASCQFTCAEVPHLRSHVLTHLSSSQPQPKHPSQSETVTLALGTWDVNSHPPTGRPIPPPRNATLTYDRPVRDPHSVALTALLIIRVLFRTAFASNEAAPKADADHFGFPGIVEDDNEPAAEVTGTDPELDKEGERKGRKAFIGIRHMLQNVRLRDEALMSWVTEMVDATIPELS